MKKNFTVLTLAFFGGTCALFGADPLDDLKKFSADGVGGPAAVMVPAGFTSCEAAQAPLTVTVPGFMVSQLPFSRANMTLPLDPEIPRICVLSASGASQHDPPGKSQFTLTLNIDASTYRSNGSMGECAQASGSLSFVKTDNGAANDTVNMQVAGLYCDVAASTSAKVFTGTYNINGGTRKFAGAAGTGNIAFSFAGQTLLHADGNILSAK